MKLRFDLIKCKYVFVVLGNKKKKKKNHLQYIYYSLFIGIEAVGY